jgi:hypothetical protein
VSLVCALVCANIGLFAVCAFNCDAQHLQDGAPLPKSQLIENRRNQIALSRKEIMNESLEATIKGLLIDKPYFESGVMDPTALAQVEFKRVLSNRRTHKVVAHFATLPADTAERQYQQIFDEMYEKEYKATIERVLAFYEVPGAPENTQWMDANKLALGAILFGTAHLGKPALVVTNLRRMENARRDCCARVLQHKEVFPKNYHIALALFVELDNACKISLLDYSVQHSKREAGERIAAFQNLLKGTVQNKRPLTAWDAELTSFDADSFLANYPLDKDTVVEWVPWYEWDNNHLVKSAFQADVVERLMALCAQWD